MPTRVARSLYLAVAGTLVAGVVSAIPSASNAEAPAAGPAPAPPPVVDDLFRDLPGFRINTERRTSVTPNAYEALALDFDAAETALADAPTGEQASRGGSPAKVELPTPDGDTEVFEIVEDSVMAPQLQADYPDIRSYAGRSVENPTHTVRLDLSPLGLHASVRSAGGGNTWYINPAYRGQYSATHLVFNGSDAAPAERTFNEEGVFDQWDEFNASRPDPKKAAARAARALGDAVQEREFGMAWVTDPTFADYYSADGDSDEVRTTKALAAKNMINNRSNQVYNDDLGIKFVLVEGSDDLGLNTVAEATGANGPCGANPCFEQADTESCGGDVLDRNKFVAGQIVGADTFDIGHFGGGNGGGGVAYLGVVGDELKAGGCTALDTPGGDFYAVDFYAHEVGHQMGGNHTFNGTNGSCAGVNRNAETSVEPGSGSTVMAYAGICLGDDLQPHTDPYFSAITHDEMTAVVTAASPSIQEQQTINLVGLDAGDSFQLTYPGAAPQTITQGVNYNAAGLAAAVLALTGNAATIAGYDGAAAPSAAGFRVNFAGTGDFERLGVANGTGGVTGFTGVIQNGGPITNGGTLNDTSNTAPGVEAGPDKTIPAQTPFTLTATGSDNDPNTNLTYVWEQTDAGSNPITGSPLAVNPPLAKLEGPLFRVFGRAAEVSDENTLLIPSPGINLADGSPSRTLPDIEQIIAGATNAETGTCPPTNPVTTLPFGDTLECYSEFLPTAAYLPGELNFRVTARDQFLTGGGRATDSLTLSVSPTAGPFLVDSLAATETVESGTTDTIEWSVAGTAGLAANVKISLSTDGGRTYPTTILESTPNDGSQEITWPSADTSTARIKVEAIDNYFFDINDADFTIETSLTVPQLDDGETVQYSDAITPVDFVATSDVADGDELTAEITGIEGLTVTPGEASADGVRPGTRTFTVAGTVGSGPGLASAEVAVSEPGETGNTITRDFDVDVVAEDALAAYRGPSEASGPGDSVEVTLRGQIADIDDDDRGDITNATITFVDRISEQPLCTTTEIAGGPEIGVGECTATLPVTEQQTDYSIAVVVGGFYNRDNALDDGEITITRGQGTGPAPQTRITGGVPERGFATGFRAVIRYASTAEDASFGCLLNGRGVQACRQNKAVLKKLRPRGIYRFKVASSDNATGAVDRSPAVRRFAVPFPAQRAVRTNGWRFQKNKAAYQGRALVTNKRNQTLRIRAQGVRRIALVVGKGRNYGRVEVKLGNRKIGTLNLAQGKTKRRVVMKVSGFRGKKSGRLQIRTLDRKKVEIEGIGLFG